MFGKLLGKHRHAPWSAVSCVAMAAAMGPMVVAQDAALRERVNRALTDARPAMLAHLRDATADLVQPGPLALLLLASIHDGVPATDVAFAAALQKLAKANPEATYDLSLRLLVMEAWPDFPDRTSLAKRDARELLTHRDSSGAFGYSPNPVNWDLSNTQYAALGLRAAKALGATVDRTVWSKMAREIGEQQDTYGGFGYVKGGDERANSYASMTAAGVAVLAVCRQALGEESRQGSAMQKQLTRGWQWFDRNPAVIGSSTERWSYYFHYGLERAAILCDVEKVGGKDWYALGAEMLVRDQLPGGGWQGDADVGLMGRNAPVRGKEKSSGQPASTAFAVLFLRRKFQKISGPITPHIVTLAAIGPKATAQDLEDCVAELVRRGKAAVPDVLLAMRSELAPQREAAAKALAELAGEDFGYDPKLDAEQNGAALRKAELWHLRNR